MDERTTLRSHLNRFASQAPQGAAIGEVIEAIAAAAVDLAALLADGPLAGITGQNGGINSDGDRQKDIDVAAHEIMRCALRAAPVAAILSEEAALPETFRPEAPLCVAIDPLDGSANLENNISVGTIFSIRPRGKDLVSTFFEPGTAQCAAGFAVYGPQTTLVLALDRRVDIFILDRRTQQFLLVRHAVQVALDTPEFAINASNRRHWYGPVRAYIDECLAGTQGGARRISTCAGSVRWLRIRFESWFAAACFFIRPTPAPATATEGFACSTKPTRWRWSWNGRVARPRPGGGEYWKWLRKRRISGCR